MTRRFLFLQGPSAPFFARLAGALAAQGAAVFRINFCAGDALYWGRRPAWNFRRALEDLPEYLAARCAHERITDFVLFGDLRPVHRAAIELARRGGIRVHAFEEGYIRPNWITLERGGVNAASRLPRDPAWYQEVSAALPDPGEGVRIVPAIGPRAAHDAAYHAANLVNEIAYPGYFTHRPYLAGLEYLGWALRFARFPWRLRQDARRIRALIESGAPYYLFPLQLNADAQVASHSPFGTMRNAIEQVLWSFARHAPAGTKIAIKNHPLDTGLAGYARLVRRLARAYDLAGRVEFLESGDLAALLDRARGVVLVNSTVGLSALQHRRPTKALGEAIYDLPGLTSRCALDDFWRDTEPPDLDLCRAFRNVVVHATQVNGGFYTAQGIAVATEGAVARLLERQSRLEQLLERFPAPRVAPPSGAVAT